MKKFMLALLGVLALCFVTGCNPNPTEDNPTDDVKTDPSIHGSWELSQDVGTLLITFSDDPESENSGLFELTGDITTVTGDIFKGIVLNGTYYAKSNYLYMCVKGGTAKKTTGEELELTDENNGGLARAILPKFIFEPYEYSVNGVGDKLSLVLGEDTVTLNRLTPVLPANTTKDPALYKTWRQHYPWGFTYYTFEDDPSSSTTGKLTISCIKLDNNIETVTTANAVFGTLDGTLYISVTDATVEEPTGKNTLSAAQFYFTLAKEFPAFISSPAAYSITEDGLVIKVGEDEQIHEEIPVIGTWKRIYSYKESIGLSNLKYNFQVPNKFTVSYDLDDDINDTTPALSLKCTGTWQYEDGVLSTEDISGTTLESGELWNNADPTSEANGTIGNDRPVFGKSTMALFSDDVNLTSIFVSEDKEVEYKKPTKADLEGKSWYRTVYNKNEVFNKYTFKFSGDNVERHDDSQIGIIDSKGTYTLDETGKIVCTYSYKLINTANGTRGGEIADEANYETESYIAECINDILVLHSADPSKEFSYYLVNFTPAEE